MAHPDHDQDIGRLVGARLRGSAIGRPVGAGAVEAHPDAEAWAAYVDGGLLPEEVGRLDTHLTACATCRRLVAVMMPETSAATVPARVAETPTAARGTVVPFPRPQVYAWMGVAAALFAAVTLWSVSRLGSSGAEVDMARAPVLERAAPVAAPPTADVATPRSAVRPPGQVAAPASTDRGAAATARDLRAGRAELPAAGSLAFGAASAPAGPAAAPEEDKRLADTARAPAAARAEAPAVNARQIPLQTNSAATGAARPHGPLATQSNQQQNASAPQASAIAPPMPVAAVAAPLTPASPPAPTDGEKTEREQRGNQQQAGLAERVTTTGAATGARTVPLRRAAAKASEERADAALAKDEAAKVVASGETADVSLPSFAEPGGRLRWRIAEGRRLESSSDGGTTWTSRFTTARGSRLRAGAAPAIDSAWAVGDRGLVLRLSVPGGWAAVAPPDAATLIAVSATDGRSARVTAADGRVFETADGGATWTPAGAGSR